MPGPQIAPASYSSTRLPFGTVIGVGFEIPWVSQGKKGETTQKAPVPRTIYYLLVRSYRAEDEEHDEKKGP